MLSPANLDWYGCGLSPVVEPGGNAAVSVELTCTNEAALMAHLDAWWDDRLSHLAGAVLASSISDREQHPTSPGMVWFSTKPSEELYWRAVKEEVGLNDLPEATRVTGAATDESVPRRRLHGRGEHARGKRLRGEASLPADHDSSIRRPCWWWTQRRALCSPATREKARDWLHRGAFHPCCSGFEPHPTRLPRPHAMLCWRRRVQNRASGRLFFAPTRPAEIISTCLCVCAWSRSRFIRSASTLASKPTARRFFPTSRVGPSIDWPDGFNRRMLFLFKASSTTTAAFTPSA